MRVWAIVIIFFKHQKTGGLPDTAQRLQDDCISALYYYCSESSSYAQRSKLVLQECEMQASYNETVDVYLLG